MEAESIEDRFPIVVDEFRIAEATFMQLRRSGSTGLQVVAVRMGEWVVELKGLNSHHDVERCAKFILAMAPQELGTNEFNGNENPSREQLEADRDAILAAGKNIISRLTVISRILSSDSVSGDLNTKSREAISKCREKLDQQRNLFEMHEHLVRQSERCIVLSRAKLALCKNEPSHYTAEELIEMYENVMQDMREKRYALIDEKCAISEQEQALQELTEQLVGC